MSELEAEGRFWLPEQPERLVAGKVSSSEDGVTLTLDDSLRELAWPAEAVVRGPARSEHALLRGTTQEVGT